MKSAQAENTYWVILTIAFVAVCAITAANHELWRDEANSWLIARESASFLEVFDRARHKGHPYLWEALLLPVSRISSSPAAMQIFSLMIATAAVWIFLRYSPFSTLHKTLFVFGFFPVYEYSVMARPYGLSLLLLFVFSALFRKRNERFLTICLVVALLSNSNAVGFILGAACGGLLLFDVFFANGFRAGGFRNPTARQYAGLALIALGTTAGFLSILPGTEHIKSDLVSLLKGASDRPPENGSVSEPKNASDRLPASPSYTNVVKYLGGIIYRARKTYSPAFLPIPDGHLEALLGKEPYKNVAETLHQLRNPLLLLVAYLTFLLYTVIRKSPHALLFWFLATAGLAVLFVFIFYGSLRHHGFFFIVLMMSLWLLCATGGNPKEKLKPFNAALTVILSLHLAAGATAVFADGRLPFSNAKKTAEFISQEVPANTFVFAWASTDSVAVYMKKGARISFSEYNRVTDKEAFFYDFHPTILVGSKMPIGFVLDQAQRFDNEKSRAVLLIFNEPLDENVSKKYGLSEKARFTGAIIRWKENFWLYEMPAPAGGRTTPAGTSS